MTVIDAHTHILTETMIDAIAREVPSLAPKLTRVDAESSALELLGVKQNPFPRGAWDLGVASLLTAATGRSYSPAGPASTRGTRNCSEVRAAFNGRRWC